jgi:hypothetical protein
VREDAGSPTGIIYKSIGYSVSIWLESQYYENNNFINILPILTFYQRRRMPHLLVGFFPLPVKLEPSYDYRDPRIN